MWVQEIRSEQERDYVNGENDPAMPSDRKPPTPPVTFCREPVWLFAFHLVGTLSRSEVYDRQLNGTKLDFQ